MSIIDNINEQLVFDKNKIYPGGEELIEKIVTQKNLNEIRLKAQWKVMSEYEIYCDRKVDFDEKDLDLQKGELEKARRD